MSVTHPQRATRGQRIALWTVAAVVAILLFMTLWVTVRALAARDELLGAVPLARTIASNALSATGKDISADVEDLQGRASTAASLTSDPIWRAAEGVPMLGANLTAFRQAASMIEQVTGDALPPLANLASTFTVDSLSPNDGAFDLQPFRDAAPQLGEARAGLDSAATLAAEIDTTNTVTQIGEAVDQLIDLVDEAKGIVTGLDTAASLLPQMLGADGPRNYLLLSLNNAELRATGGIPGAVAVVSANNGKLALGAQATASSLGEYDAPVLPLTGSEQTLYQNILGTYMQDVTFTPDFARSGALAQAMWQQSTGQTVDGVIALDPVALSYLLEATGPIETDAGLTLSADNAVDVLLSDVYAQFEEPTGQDKFFAGVTGQIFAAMTGGTADKAALVSALVRSADEGRIHLWSANAEEHEQLKGLPVAGALPVNTEETTGFGVYLNDATGAKMDYYLRGAIGIGSAVCRVDQRPNFEVRVNLNSTAPADAATSLPAYVTGAGAFGVAPGNIRTNIFVYAPEGAIVYSVTIDGAEHAFVAAEHDGRPVAGVTVEIPPGQRSDLSFKFVGVAGNPTAVSLRHTPMASEVATSLDNYLDCGAVTPPAEDDPSQSLGENRASMAVG